MNLVVVGLERDLLTLFVIMSIFDTMTILVKMNPMDDDKRRRVRDAALGVFLRFGYRKVTMDDIARGAGMSRPALYLVFPNKEAVFREVVRVGLDQLLDDIERGLPGRPTLADQLMHVFRVSSVGSFELVGRAPAAAELLHASFDFVGDLFEQYDRRLAEILARLLRAAARDPDALQPSAEKRAWVLIAAARGFKSLAKDAGGLRMMVGDLVQMTVAGIPGAASVPRRPAPGVRPRPRR
jgi:AcrR family transcriptional regulator